MRVGGWVFGEEGWEFAYWKCFQGDMNLSGS